MKKQIKLALTTLMVLSSVNAWAMTNTEIDRLNTEGKIEAAMADQRCSDCDSMDLMEGKMAATAMVNMRIMVADSQKRVDEISRIGEMVGNSMEDSHGLLKFIGEKETFAEMALNEMKNLEKKAEALDGDELFSVHSRMTKLSLEIRSLNEETQITLDKIFSRSK